MYRTVRSAITNYQRELVGGGILLAVLVAVVFVGPTVVFPDESESETALAVTEAMLFTNDGSEVALETDTQIATTTEVWVENDGSLVDGAVMNRQFRYDASAERVLITVEHTNEAYSFDTTMYDNRVFTTTTYYERSDSGQFEKYQLRRYYDFQQNAYVPFEGDSCKVTETKYVRHTTTSSSIEQDQRPPFTYYPFDIGGRIFMFSQQQATDELTISVADSTHMASRYSNSLVRTTESSGSVTATQTNMGYQIQDADVHAEATVFDNVGSVPLINYTTPLDATFNYSVTTQKTNTTVERPSWVQTYDQEC